MNVRTQWAGLVVLMGLGCLALTSYWRSRLEPTRSFRPPPDKRLDEFFYRWIHTETDGVEWVRVCGDHVMLGFDRWTSECPRILKAAGRAASLRVEQPVWLWAVPSELSERPPALRPAFWGEPRFPYYADLVAHRGRIRGRVSGGAPRRVWEEWENSRDHEKAPRREPGTHTGGGLVVDSSHSVR